MKRKLLWFLSAVLAFGICVPGGALQALAAESEASTFGENALRAPSASGFHATITSNKDSYSAGSTAIFSVKYTIDQGAFKEGDTVRVIIPTEVASKARLSVDPLHFSSVTDKGNGTWELTFGPNASAALAGSFSMYITAAEVTKQTTAPISVGDGSKDFTVIPKGSAGGVGVYSDAIMKDVNDPKVSYGDYDYSEGHGKDAAQIGVYDSTNDESIGYRLFVNNKRAAMDGVTVVDTLPDGMSFDRTRGVRVTTPAGDELDPSLYSVDISGQELTFRHPGTLTDTVWIHYWVNARGGTGVKYTNRAEINYQSGGTTYQEHRNYVLQGNDYNAACGEKSVDKTVISSDPADQRVTYAIKFWNNNGFDVGAIKLTDKLDDHVRFVYADAGDKFDVKYDEASHSVLISNTSAISGSETEYVRFVVDFSDVPEGYTVENSVGGNTTKTLKMPTVQLSAVKTVDGQTPGAGQAFAFQLCDAQGAVLQEKHNIGGAVSFDKLVYSEDDLAADGSDSVMRYIVKEKAGDGDAYVYDGAVYDVAVTLHREIGADGKTTVTATPVITKAGVPVDSMRFDNRSNLVSVPVSKAWIGPKGTEVTVKLLADDVEVPGKTLTLNAGNGWTGSFDGLVKYAADGHEIAYTVTEAQVSGVDASKYSTAVTGDAAGGYVITNTNTETVTIKGSKTWDDDGDRDGVRPDEITIRLRADGNEVASDSITEADGWAWSFDGLLKYATDGHEIVYTVTEDAVPDYVTTVNDADSITNAYAPGRISVTATKVWDDASDQDGIRPASIRLQLYANDAPFGDPVTLDAGNRWTYTWTNLFQKEGGQDIGYTVGELDVPSGYQAEVAGDAASGFTVTNKHAPATTSISALKVWDDADDQDGKRASITLQLMKSVDGGEARPVAGQDKSIAADAQGADLEVVWSDLPAKEAGRDIAYTVVEKSVPDGYQVEVTGDAASGFVVTNVHAPETVAIPVTKRWVGGEAGPVVIRLFADGADTGKSITLDAACEWTGSFGDLPRYRDGGIEIVYEVREDEVGGYTTTISGDSASGFTVTNAKDEVPPSPSNPSSYNPPQEDKPKPATLPATGDVGFPLMAVAAVLMLAAGGAAFVASRARRGKRC